MSSRGGKKYRICTDSIAHTAGTPKRSTWSPAAKSRYDRCLRKVENNKHINELSPTKPTGPAGSPTANLASAKFGRDLSRQPTITQRRTTRQEKEPTVIGGKKVGMEASHTVYDRIGALLSEKKESGRREGEDKHVEGRRGRKRASKISRFIDGAKRTITGPLNLRLQGYTQSGGVNRTPPEQHKEKSPD